MTDICRNVRKFAPKFEIEYSMRRIFQAFCGLFAAGLLLTSCLNGDDSDVIVYNDMSIQAFTLGTLDRYLHTTTSAGEDSVYKVTYSASAYKMEIDQLKHKISNVDSLLTGTDMTRVICSVTTKNNGVVLLQSMTSDSLNYFSSGNDSVDFSQPRVFRVYATDGSGYRDYTVSLSARTQIAGVFGWVDADAADFPHPEDNTVREAAEAAGLSYIGRTHTEAYAMNADGIIMESTDVGNTWAEAIFDTDVALLPKDNMAYTSWNIDVRTDYALLVGQNPASDKAMVIWRKLADYERKGQWVYMPLDDENPYYLPKMDNVSLVCYGNGVLAFGSNQNVYVSRDQGITWKTTSTYAFPDGFTPGHQFQVATDGQGYIWLTDTVSGQTWKGRLSD